MTTSNGPIHPADEPRGGPAADVAPTRGPLRLALAETAGSNRLDGAWWPWSRDLAVEPPDLVDHFPSQSGRVVLSGRGEPTGERAGRLQALRDIGGDRVSYRSVDLEDAASVASLVAWVRETNAPLASARWEIRAVSASAWRPGFWATRCSTIKGC